MTTTRTRAHLTPTASLIVRVAVLGGSAGLIAPLRDRLDALAPHDLAWRVEPDAAVTGEPDVVLAAGAELVGSARRRWPSVAVIGLVPAHDDSTGALAAFEAGALVCVRGTDPGLVAAYIRSVARRRGLLGLTVPA